MSFKNLNLIDPIFQAIKSKGYVEPTPIQTKSIPVILQGKDLLGCAQTGTGKTAAFAIPILQILHKDKGLVNGKKIIRALIITPTRELAIQIDESFSDYGKGTGLKHTVIFGGVNSHSQIRKLNSGVDVLVATPGRLLDLMNQGYVNLSKLKIFTLDEADRMLDMGFINDIKKIIKELPAKRQSLFFSATMPTTIIKLANSLLRNPTKVEVAPVSSTAETVKQKMYLVDKGNKKFLLNHLLSNENIQSALVFTRTKHGADRIAKFMNQSGIMSAAIHGNKSQNARQNALRDFKDKKLRILVATDIAARGIDINELSHVINFEIPNEPETYVHRIGRTGRAKNSGIAFSFCDKDEQIFVKDIHKLIKKPIPIEDKHPFPMKDFVVKTEVAKKKKYKPRRGFRRS